MSSRLPDNSSLESSWLRAHFAELAIFCFAVSLLFIKLGIGEFEDWDESHIVYRAHVIEKHGAWLDQSQYALGGLYSSAHPPLGVWMMVASRAIFGNTECTTRLPAALCGLIAAISMFFLLRRWCGDRTALLLAAAFTSCSIFLWYARHAQLDSLLISTSLASVALFCTALERRSQRYATIAGICFGLAMLSKFGWAIYVLPFVLGYWYVHGKDRALLLAYIIPGLVIGSSWYLYMIATNSAFVDSVFGWIVGLSSVAGYETAEKSPLYYFNQLIIACPFIVLAVISIVKRKEWTLDRWLTLGWLALVMLVLQIAVTKFPHFALMLLPPAFAVVAQPLKDDSKRSWVECILLALAVLWSLSTQFRLMIRGAEFDYIAPHWEIAVPLAIALTALVMIQRRHLKRALITGLTGLVVIVAATRVIGTPDDLYDDGAKHIANTLLPRASITKVVVVHSGLPHDSLTPRLAYYTNGWTSGWLQGRKSQKMGWPDDTLLRSLTEKAHANTAVVLERERDRFAAPIERTLPQYAETINLLKQKYQHYDSLRSYDLFYD